MVSDDTVPAVVIRTSSFVTALQASQLTVTLASGSASNQQATLAQLTAQERSLYEVGGVHKKHMTLATVYRFELRRHLFFEKLGLNGHMFLDGFLRRQ